MKIIVKAKLERKKEMVEPAVQPTSSLGDTDVIYTVSVKQSPVEGAANKAIARVLAKHFGVAVSRIRLLHGTRSKQKIFEIE